MSIHEKSAWVSIVAILGLYIPYFMVVDVHPLQGLYRFWVVGIGMAVIMGVFRAVDAIVQVVQQRAGTMVVVDELDRLIQYKAALLSGVILACVVVIWVIGMMYVLPLHATTMVETTSDGVYSHAAWPITDVMRTVHWLFAGFVATNLLYYVAIIVQYRSMRDEP